MKNILILGTAKSGKSYLSKKICEEYNYNHIPLDYFASSFKHNIPEIGITSNVIIDEKSSKKLSLFLSRIISIMDYVDDEKYIIDSAHIYPEDIIPFIDIEKWDIYCLGYPNITVEDKLRELRKYVHKGWPIEKTDEELEKIISKLIIIGRKMEEQCKKSNIKFVDTSNFKSLNELKIKKGKNEK